MMKGAGDLDVDPTELFDVLIQIQFACGLSCGGPEQDQTAQILQGFVWDQ